MRIVNVLSKLITEDAKYQYLNKKYILPNGNRERGILPFDIVKKIIFADPTTRVSEDFDKEGASTNDMENVKVGKYSEWMIKQFIKPNLKNEDTGEPIEIGSDEYKREATEYRRHFMEDLPQFKDLLTKYERFKGSLADASKKNIDNVKSFTELLTGKFLFDFL
jgi:hypothetical protein